jgi:hypothetical protein
MPFLLNGPKALHDEFFVIFLENKSDGFHG